MGVKEDLIQGLGGRGGKYSHRRPWFEFGGFTAFANIQPKPNKNRATAKQGKCILVWGVWYTLHASRIGAQETQFLELCSRKGCIPLRNFVRQFSFATSFPKKIRFTKS